MKLTMLGFLWKKLKNPKERERKTLVVIFFFAFEKKHFFH